MNNYSKYIVSSLLGANLPLIIGMFFAIMLSFLLNDTYFIKGMWDATVSCYTEISSGKWRVLVVSWFIFGHMIYLSWKEL